MVIAIAIVVAIIWWCICCDDNGYIRNATEIVLEGSGGFRLTPRQAMQKAWNGFHRCLQLGHQHTGIPYNTGSGSRYVDLDFHTSRSELKDMWKNKSYGGFTFKASDSWSDHNAIDLKV